MFNDLTIFQNYWWIIVSLLAGLLIFLFFVQGGQSLLWQISKGDNKKEDLIVNTLGRKWEIGFTTLVMFGGAIFAAFPKLYATTFGGAYFLWMLILFSYIIQAVSYEYRKKHGNLIGPKGFELFLHINGLFSVFLIGIAVGTLFTGAPFELNQHGLVKWTTNYRGLLAFNSLFNISLGLSLVFLSRVLGATYLINSIKNEEIEKDSRKQVLINTLLFLPPFLFFAFNLLTQYHFIISTLLILLLGVLLVLFGIFATLQLKKDYAFWIISLGSIFVGFSLFLNLGFGIEKIYPSTINNIHSLTIRNSSSAIYTLKVMSIVSLMIPFVITYISYVWSKMNKSKLSSNEIISSHHKY